MSNTLSHSLNMLGSAVTATLHFVTLVTGSFFNQADFSDADNSGYAILLF
jgi:hypothetical protein